jgi:hypothetical protein
MKQSGRSLSSADELIVGRQKHVNASPLRTGKMESIEGAESQFLDSLGALRIESARDHDLVSKDKQSLCVPSALRVWIASYFDVQNRAANPCQGALAHQCENAFHGFRLAEDAWLGLIIC